MYESKHKRSDSGARYTSGYNPSNKPDTNPYIHANSAAAPTGIFRNRYTAWAREHLTANCGPAASGLSESQMERR